MKDVKSWRNLAPKLVRQRVLIEGVTHTIVEPEKIKEYLLELAKVTDMEVLAGPFVGNAHELGFSGWIHWRTSGTHFYSYPAREVWQMNKALFTVDIYTCKTFSPEKTVDFTKKFLNALDIVWKEIEV